MATVVYLNEPLERIKTRGTTREYVKKGRGHKEVVVCGACKQNLLFAACLRPLWIQEKTKEGVTVRDKGIMVEVVWVYCKKCDSEHLPDMIPGNPVYEHEVERPGSAWR